ncbi:hypothetical protein TrST_g10455 [Triparma strigata]|uniref:Uncharacterized protein n=1 Tax=Triparma strigata TaxID=1606541 RepID=A0A9W7B4N9_9STRA|nr:hypothetical protein TrST_g10455 [Triparma strigata]
MKLLTLATAYLYLITTSSASAPTKPHEDDQLYKYRSPASPRAASLSDESKTFATVGRYKSTPEGYPSFGYGMSGVSFDVTPNPDTSSSEFTLYITLSLPTVDPWYKMYSKSKDGCRFAVFRDGERVGEDIVIKPDDEDPVRKVTLSSNSNSGSGSKSVKVQVLRISEDVYSKGDGNGVVFRGVTADGATLSTPAPPTLTAHFVGDSDTAGFGIHSHPNDPHCLFPKQLWSKISDASLSWASQLGKLMGAEVTLTAISGVGVDGEYGLSPWTTYMDRALPYDDSAEGVWEYYAHESPDFVFVLIGPNDCGMTHSKSCPDDWESNYISLLNHYRNVYGNKPKLVSVIGGSGSGYNDSLLSATQDAIDTFADGGGEATLVKVSKEVWDSVNDGGSNGNNGCMGHYNEKGHGMVANDLFKTLQEMNLL